MAEVKNDVNDMKEPTNITSSVGESNHDIESGSGSENGEKPVREKLKKTDLEEEIGEHDPSTTEPNGAGKLKKKRSYEDLLHEEGTEVDTSLDDAHTRKKTREALTPSTKEPVETTEHLEVALEDTEDAKHSDANGDKISSTPPSSNEVMEDADDSVKVRRKRSAEEMSDPPKSLRSPKIVATDAERERRSSSAAASDKSRSADSEPQDATSLSPPRSVPQDDKAEARKKADAASHTNSGFNNTSAVSPFASLSSKTKESSTESQHQTSASAFAASGFAALASSSSPFGALAKEKSPTTGDKPQTTSSAFTSSGFAALSGSTSAFGAAAEKSQPTTTKADTSPFASAGAKTGFGFGTQSFGSGFGGTFGSGQKLSSFAAPVGDTKLGSTSTAKPFGAPEASEDDEDASDDENEDGEDSSSNAFGGSTSESTSQFKVQDDHTTGEEDESTSFLANAKLYQYSGSAGWVERGVGPFKLNYKIVDADTTDPQPGSPPSFEDLTPGQAEIDARFIMRNAATHKVIVNARIFKEMKVGDRAGGEPEKKNEIFFSAHSETGLTPYLLRMGKKDDSKELYDQVKKIQRLL